MDHKAFLLLGCSIAMTGGLAFSGEAQAPRSPTPAAIEGIVDVETVAEGLEHPWGLTFLPDQRMLVTERPGRLRIATLAGTLSEPLAGVPPVQQGGQGGLLDVQLDPRFEQNGFLYLSFAEPAEDGTAGTSVVRARLVAEKLEDVQVIYRQQPKVKGNLHFGSRLVFLHDGTMIVTQGERFEYRNQAQDLTSGLGKIVRINSDGSIPGDNPFVNKPPVRPELWSYGHRNVQAAAIHPETGQLWTVEHGARGGDELNHPEPGKNYGWPIISYGVNYDGTSIGEGTAKAGMEQPVYYWDPVIAPSGMTFYCGGTYPGWQGSLFVGSLKPGLLVRLVLKNGRVEGEERYLGELGERIREVKEGPDGFLYLLTDANHGRILRVVKRE